MQRPVAELRPPARNVRPPAPDHVRGVRASIAAFGVCRPVLVDADGRVVDGWAVVEAARELCLPSLPCIVVDHLSGTELKALRIALNRLGEKGTWDLGALKLEFDDIVLDDVPLTVTGFTLPEIDAIRLEGDPPAAEPGPIVPSSDGEPRAKPGDIFALGPHRIACGDARDGALLARLMENAEARLVLTDVPYNVPIRGHVTGGDHREFAMAAGEMSAAEFAAFNAEWMAAAGAHLRDGGVLGTFIDWRGWATVHGAALACSLDPLNLVVWSKTNAGMGSLYRSAHELLPLFEKGRAAHINNVELGRHGRWRSNVWSTRAPRPSAPMPARVCRSTRP